MTYVRADNDHGCTNSCNLSLAKTFISHDKCCALLSLLLPPYILVQVPDPEQQHRVMIEAVENHMPQVVVIDEIGTEAECQAARTIAQRGVQLVATAHGNELQNLIKNPALSDLVGGIQSVTLGEVD